MNVWIVNPFDPLPGDPEQEGRYATLARMLADRGHRVTWWTSAFSHRFKRPVDQAAIRAACAAVGTEPRFLEAPPYTRNVGWARVRNHRMLARQFRAAAPAATPAPDVVVASSPPPGLALAASEVGRARGARTIVDVQDLWPDNFCRLAPRLLGPLVDLALRPALRTAQRAYARCDAVVGVADAYVERALALAGERKPTLMVPLGVDVAAFDQAAAAGRCATWTKPAGEIWLAYTGSLTRNYDFLTVIRAAALLRPAHPHGVRFFVTGRGELSTQAEQLVREQGLSNVTLTGFMEFNAWAYLLTQCDAAFNAARPEALIYLPNKFFYYLAAGAAVLNTIPGQCSRIVREGRCGVDYRAGDVEDCARVVERLLNDRPGMAAMGQAARKLAEATYDRTVLYREFSQFMAQFAQSDH